MDWKLITSLIASIGFATAAMSAYYALRFRVQRATPLMCVAGGVAVLVNVVFLTHSLRQFGMLETFHHSFEATLLLAGLIGATGLILHVTRSLRGLDGFLFLFATLVQLGSFAVLNGQGRELDYKPWFVSHLLAFVVSATCFVAGGTAGVAYLLMNRLLRAKRASTLVGQVASLESLDQFGRWAVMVGFPFFTYGVLTGVCEMVRDAEPRAWLFDPFVMLTFVTWTVYAVMVGFIWFRPQFRGRQSATFATCGMALVGVVFLVVELISPVHR